MTSDYQIAVCVTYFNTCMPLIKKKWRRQRLNFVTYEGKILSMAKDEVAQIQDFDDLSVQADTDKKEICGLRIVA